MIRKKKGKTSKFVTNNWKRKKGINNMEWINRYNGKQKFWDREKCENVDTLHSYK